MNGTYTMVIWYFEEGSAVLWIGWCGTSKRVVWYFEKGDIHTVLETGINLYGFDSRWEAQSAICEPVSQFSSTKYKTELYDAVTWNIHQCEGEKRHEVI